MRRGESVGINPFDDEDGGFLVSVSDAKRHSCWPTLAGVPADWRVIYGDVNHAASLRRRASDRSMA